MLNVLLGVKAPINENQGMQKMPKILNKLFFFLIFRLINILKERVTCLVVLCPFSTAYRRYDLNRTVVLLFSKNTDSSVYLIQENSLINLLAYLSQGSLFLALNMNCFQLNKYRCYFRILQAQVSNALIRMELRKENTKTKSQIIIDRIQE